MSPSGDGWFGRPILRPAKEPPLPQIQHPAGHPPGLGLLPLPTALLGGVSQETGERYFPPSEQDGGWRIGDPRVLGVDVGQLAGAINYHDSAAFTKRYGGALVIVYKGHVIGESYVTGAEGGPQPWMRRTCNSLASSTKSVFGTAVGVFLEEYKDRVNLDTYLVGQSRDDSLIPQIWDQPITDERKKKIKVKHVLSMTSGMKGKSRGHHRAHTFTTLATRVRSKCTSTVSAGGISMECPRITP